MHLLKILNNEFSPFEIIFLNNAIISITRFKINYIKAYIAFSCHPRF